MKTVLRILHSEENISHVMVTIYTIYIIFCMNMSRKYKISAENILIKTGKLLSQS